MNIKIQISDELYKTLVASGKRIRGSIALVTPKEGNFSAYATSRGMRKVRKFIKLPHGRASVSEEDVRLTLCVERMEQHVMPAAVIIDESAQASVFVDQVTPSGNWKK